MLDQIFVARSFLPCCLGQSSHNIPLVIAREDRDALFRSTVADRHRDLAVAATDVASRLGPMLVPVFFDRYGARPDPLRLDWWALAHQLLR